MPTTAANEDEPSARGKRRNLPEDCGGVEAELATLRAETERLRLILGSAVDFAIVTMDTGGHITSWNPGAERVLGYTETDVIGWTGEIVFTPEDRAAGVFNRELERAKEHGTATNERWHLRRDGTRFWASGTMMPLRGSAGQLQGFLNIMRDRTDLRIEAERRELLIGEMGHRLRNTFAVVQAVAARSGRHSDTVAGFLAAFDARLRALARSHDVLVHAGWEDTPLHDVITEALAVHDGASIRIAGGDAPALLPANLIVPVSLALHELATNAVKHGSLSVPEGRVDVTWTVDGGGPGPRKAEIVWRESGGPPVRVRERRGFGTGLLEKGTGGLARLDFRPEGVECRMTLPVRSTP